MHVSCHCEEDKACTSRDCPWDRRVENWSKPIIPILNGYNYLDLGWDPNGDIWAGGGNGTLIVSKDQGETWNSDPTASGLPTNYIKILFLDKEDLDNPKGFVLGERGYIHKWNS